MALETTKWDIQDSLKTPEDIAAYLEAILEDGNPTLIAARVGDAVTALKALGLRLAAQNEKHA